MTITTREEARAIMRQCESMEVYLPKLSATVAVMEEEYNALMNALDNYFLSAEQRRGLDSFDGSSQAAYDLAVSLGVDPDFAEWLYL